MANSLPYRQRESNKSVHGTRQVVFVFTTVSSSWYRFTHYCLGCTHRDRYLEQQQTEKIETEVRDVDRIRCTKVYAYCPGLPSGGCKSTPVKHKHILLPPACNYPLLTEALHGSWPGRFSLCSLATLFSHSLCQQRMQKHVKPSN
jgi:hypothetical protein